ncbi:Odorant receptor Or2 [Anthophora quadrimaculata]
MGKSVTVEQAISFTKLSVALTCSWPLSPLATKTQVLFFNTLWCTAFVSTITLLLPLLSGIYEYRKDPIILGKTVSLASAVAQVTIKMIMCRFQQKQFQASAGMAIDTQIAFLLRYAAARFEILGNEMRNAKTDCKFNACIETHIEILRYTKRIRQSVKFLILTTIATTTVAVIFGSLNLIANQPLLLKALYAIVVFSASVELFMYAWPADSLMRMSTKLATDIYNTDWLGKDVKLQKKVYCIILRSQRLEAIRIDGVVPKLSLPYYAMYLYKSLSYFTALRIIVESETTIETA